MNNAIDGFTLPNFPYRAAQFAPVDSGHVNDGSGWVAYYAHADGTRSGRVHNGSFVSLDAVKAHLQARRNAGDPARFLIARPGA